MEEYTFNKEDIDDILSVFIEGSERYTLYHRYLDELNKFLRYKKKYEINKRKGKNIKCPPGSSENNEIVFTKISGGERIECGNWYLEVISPKYLYIENLFEKYNSELNIVSKNLRKLKDYVNNNNSNQKIVEEFEENKKRYFIIIENIEFIKDYKIKINELFLKGNDINLKKNEIYSLKSDLYILSHNLKKTTNEKSKSDRITYLELCKTISQKENELNELKNIIENIPNYIILDNPIINKSEKKKKKKTKKNKIKIKKKTKKNEENFNINENKFMKKINTTLIDNNGSDMSSKKGFKSGECIFPFYKTPKSKSLNYDCVSSKTGEWCATEIDENRVLKNKAYCIKNNDNKSDGIQEEVVIKKLQLNKNSNQQEAAIEKMNEQLEELQLEELQLEQLEELQLNKNSNKQEVAIEKINEQFDNYNSNNNSNNNSNKNSKHQEVAIEKINEQFDNYNSNKYEKDLSWSNNQKEIEIYIENYIKHYLINKDNKNKKKLSVKMVREHLEKKFNIQFNSTIKNDLKKFVNIKYNEFK